MTYRPPYEPPADPATQDADEAYLRHRASGETLPGFDLDPRERQRWMRQTRRVKTVQALVVFWLCASPFVVVPLLLHHAPWWVAAAVAGVAGAVVGYLLPTNVPLPRYTPNTGGAYGVYDPRGPHGPRS